MKIESSVDMAYVYVISKFGCDRRNISFRNVLLKNMSYLSKFGGHKPQQKGTDLIFIINSAKSS